MNKKYQTFNTETNNTHNIINNFGVVNNKNVKINPINNNVIEINNKNMNINQINNNINKNNMNNNQSGKNSNITMENLYNNNLFKNIVKQYKDKIKELKEILHKKEIEINSLKDKLSQSASNPMMNNMNQMNLMMPMNQFNHFVQNMNQFSDNKISIIFNYNENKEIIITIYDELMISVINRYCKNKYSNPEDYNFIFNGKKINGKLTVGESGLNNNSIIFVQKIKNNNLFNTNLTNNINKDYDSIQNIIFKTDTGAITNILCNTKDTIEIMIRKYLQKMDLDENLVKIENIFFIYQGKKFH